MKLGGREGVEEIPSAESVIARLIRDPFDEGAVRAYLEAKKSGPHDPVIVGFELADIYVGAGLLEHARETLEALLEQAANENDRESWDEISAKMDALGL